MTAARTVRHYLIINPSPLFAPHRRIRFTSAAPVGSVIRDRIDGRPVRIWLTGDPLTGGLITAQILDCWL